MLINSLSLINKIISFEFAYQIKMTFRFNKLAFVPLAKPAVTDQDFIKGAILIPLEITWIVVNVLKYDTQNVHKYRRFLRYHLKKMLRCSWCSCRSPALARLQICDFSKQLNTGLVQQQGIEESVFFVLCSLWNEKEGPISVIVKNLSEICWEFPRYFLTDDHYNNTQTE